MTARLTVVVGGGGVGKTTASAALALAQARQGRRSLVVTVDPARRLADALGSEVGIEATRVQVDGATLFARMPDSRQSVDMFAAWLFHDDPEAHARVRNNSLYRELSDALAGMHEMVCVAVVDAELQSGSYDEVVLDTAPSRHALEFLDYPSRLVQMLEARTLTWVSALAAHAGAVLEDRPQDKGLLAWGKRRVQGLVSMVVGAEAIREVAALFSDLIRVRERWMELLKRVEQRLSAPNTRYVVVSGPAGSALDDAGYLVSQLKERKLKPERMLLNRALAESPAWFAQLANEQRAGAFAELIRSYELELEQRRSQTRVAIAGLQRLSQAQLTVLPWLRSADPRTILTTLADALAES